MEFDTLLEELIKLDYFKDNESYEELINVILKDDSLIQKLKSKAEIMILEETEPIVSKLIEIISELAITYEKVDIDFSNVIYTSIFREYNCNISSVNYHIKLLKEFNSDISDIFHELLNNILDKNPPNIIMVLYSLYPLGVTSKNVPKEDFERLLKLVAECISSNRNNKILRLAVERELMKRIDRNEFNYYYNKLLIALD
ncbi:MULTISPECIES: hypothetical protein [unclassified Clostridium]|uniref:hypothetical protein n=1 Tax=unclassified Clostridium TaxID=2614128 RepID=UPI0002978635|nr:MULTISPECIES: hypothetical protein [unclassified Clostridium]EKQ53199.1 MAG: hypothetical protein A370_03887 [Clostridium sp. Maddingley MBC34-26]